MENTDFSPAYNIDEVINCRIEGTNLRPGNVAGDKGDSWAFMAADRAIVAASAARTPEFSAETINATDRAKLAGRHLHHKAGVWVKFCPHAGCDAFILTYGHYSHVHEVEQHAVEAHN